MLKEKSMIQFFVPMAKVPTATHQEKSVHVVNGKPVFFEPPGLKDARHKLEAYLAPYAPEAPIADGVQLMVKWLFPATGKHRDGEYKLTKPDTDNLQKLLKDVMTKLGYWKDDALVAAEQVEKFYAKQPGIFVSIRPLPRG
jgi:Holliday junction resolvase RusA-like endonuclease